MCRDDFERIYNFFGADRQRRKLVEEVYEFLKEVVLYEEGIGDIERVKSEFSDIHVVLKQFQVVHNISDDENEDNIKTAVKRTHTRMYDGYYDNNI